MLGVQPANRLMGTGQRRVCKRRPEPGCTPHGSALGPRTKTLRFATEMPEPLDFSEAWLGGIAANSNASACARPDGDSSMLDGTAVLTLDIGGDDERPTSDSMTGGPCGPLGGAIGPPGPEGIDNVSVGDMHGEGLRGGTQQKLVVEGNWGSLGERV
ncbi:hypothetical protein DFH94DRAFT_231057, partial [Russula ochroleuca]|jgi:hypothetical protein